MLGKREAQANAQIAHTYWKNKILIVRDNPAWSKITTRSMILDVFDPVARTTGSLQHK